MTKKDYELIAQALGEQIGFESEKDTYGDWTLDYKEGFTDGLKRACEVLAEVLEGDNPKFNRARFLTACGVQND